MDLKNLEEPLFRMLRNVPIGFRGEKILEVMADREIPFQRATWYIKIVRLNELVCYGNHDTFH